MSLTSYSLLFALSCPSSSKGDVRVLLESSAKLGIDQTGLKHYVDSWFNASQHVEMWPFMTFFDTEELYTHTLEAVNGVFDLDKEELKNMPAFR